MTKFFVNTRTSSLTTTTPTPSNHTIVESDCVEYLCTLKDESAQIVIADPPYNIGKNFGNKTRKGSSGGDGKILTMSQYLSWCESWMKECLRILRSDGTMFIYGFSEILAHIQVRLQEVDPTLNVRWLIWHYTNKTVPSLKFWQRSHESILCVWKAGHKYPVFNLDNVREEYTDGFLKGAAGKKRAATEGRFSRGSKETTYTAHPRGALPRDVIKTPALAGGAGKKERVNHPTQKPLALCRKLIQSARNPSLGDTELCVIPFAGSGSECVACAELGVPFVGIELNPEYVTLCKNRVSITSPPVSSTPTSE
jgi:site-specific DNA-methyltransferase (adenine-specific)